MSRAVQFAFFFGMVLLITSGLHFYVWVRLVRDTALPPPWRQAATWALVVLGLSVPAAMMLGRVLPFQVTRIATLLPYLWMGAWFLLLTVLVGIDLVKLVAFLVKKASGGGPLIADPSRRIALARIVAGAAGGVALGMTAWGATRALGRIAVRRVEVELSRLPRALSGLRIVQITDLHIGLTLGRDWVARVVDQVQRLEPDLIAVTGDLVDGTPERLQDQVQPLTRLAAPRGVFFVTGNHEYYSGVKPWLPELERLGMRVLRNERVSIGEGGDGFDLAGVDDHTAERMEEGHGPDLARALDGRDPDRELVLLAHQPKIIHEAAEQGVGLVLAGHTHGGQIWPWNQLARLQQPYISGLHRHAGQTWIYVSEGTGFWGPPIRIGTRCEITEVVLRAG
jgi:predicted MPP superfamily phosphohydrolase